MAGDADVDLAVHAFFKQFSQAREQIVQTGETLFQFDAHLADVLGDHATDEAMPRPFTALHVFTGAEIRQLLAGAEHELLMALDLAGQLRHLLDQLAQVARQGVLGQQLGEVLGGLLQPVGGGFQAGVMGKVADGLVGQVMAFVEHVQRVTRVWQYCAAAQREVGQYHVVVGDDHVNLAHAFARFIESALLEVGAMTVGALAVIGGQPRPVLVGEFLWPTVAVTVPFVARQLLQHAGEQLLAGFIDLDLEAFFLEQLRGRVGRVTLLQQCVEFGQAHVTASPLGQREGEVQTAVAHQVRQVLVDDLLLQRDGCRGNHQPFARRFGSGNCGDGVGHGLAGARPGLDSHDCRVARTTPLFIGINVPQHLGDFSDHQSLAIARLEALGFEETRVSALDLGFEFGTDHWLRFGGTAKKAG
ncbi:Uncharacterized protein ALO94_05549 [Pseudomonas syringae pv. spinaceae]|uniref:Uncharacterized protein n=1 Tax=Pseudomonas syringae pv. spinaceae TaxID=264459 RepID=A0A0Q0DR87_PSESX|nr:Uncharacterized protein ALO94_05549 [Pseudomonas syringae pv. spinaceae]